MRAGFHGLPQRRAGPEEAALDGAFGDAEHLGDLFVIQPSHIAKDQDRPLLAIQLLKGIRKRLLRLLRLDA